MGMSFRPQASAAQVIFDLKRLTPAPLEETFRAMIAQVCLLYTSPSPRDGLLSRMPSSA